MLLTDPNRIILGSGSYISPKVPTLFTALTTGVDASSPIVYGTGVNPYVIKVGKVVQIVVENHDDIEHPMHLHGYEFQVVARGSGSWNGDETKVRHIPMKRDTVTTPASGYLVIRFKANNPGVWVFHCHMEFHGIGF
jgi:iron transport multicopper oxidase